MKRRANGRSRLPKVTLHLEVLPGPSPPIVRLRQALKVLLRYHGLRATRLPKANLEELAALEARHVETSARSNKFKQAFRVGHWIDAGRGPIRITRVISFDSIEGHDMHGRMITVEVVWDYRRVDPPQVMPSGRAAA